ncbi:MAG: Threonine dehydrogenase and related Zn-dependent dehydrogenases, partial [uncultured Blastococcus sp.]
ARPDRGRSRHARSDLARPSRRAGGHRSGPGDPGAHRRHRGGHLQRHLRVRPPPHRSDGAIHDRRRRDGSRTHGHRPRGGLGGHRGEGRRPGRRPLQHLLRNLLDVLAGPAVPVRDDAEPRPGLRCLAVRLHQALRAGARRTGGVPAGALRQHAADQGARRSARRPLRLPLRRPADGMAGGAVRRHPAGRDRPRARPRADRRHVHPHRQAPRRRPGHRLRRRPGAARTRPPQRHPGHRHHEPGRRRRAGPRPDRRSRTGRGDRRRGHGGARLAPGVPGAEGDRRRPGRGHGEGHAGRRRRPAGGPQHRHRGGPPRRHDLALRRLRRCHRPAAPDAHVRQADPAAHGPGERLALGAGHPPAAARRGPPGRRRLRDAPGVPGGRSAGVHELPREAGRHRQGVDPAL